MAAGICRRLSQVPGAAEQRHFLQAGPIPRRQPQVCHLLEEKHSLGGAEFGCLLFLGLYRKGLAPQCASLLVNSFIPEGKAKATILSPPRPSFSDRPLEK